jgi:Helix-turn-helix of DDE superfamily endonuclease
MFEEVMHYDTIKQLSPDDFRRLTGVKTKTYSAMLEILRTAEESKHKSGGVAAKLSLEDRLLMALMYWREYRTYFHISQSYGVSESSCWKTIRWIENVLIKSEAFRLPGKKALLKSDIEFSVVLIDATETPCERPQKNKSTSIRGRKSGIR